MLALLCAVMLGGCATPAGASGTGVGRSALLVFLPDGGSALSRVPGLSLGILSAAQGGYSRSQLLLDIGQGARIAGSAYASGVPQLSLRPLGGGGQIEGWSAALRRARDAPQLLRPGLLAGRIPGGAAYAGIAAGGQPDAAAAAAPDGHLAAVSLGSAATLLARVRGLQRTRRLVVADLPAGPGGLSDLAALSAGRAPGELLLALQRVADPGRGALLWSAAAGLAGGGGQELSSRSTQQRGLLVSIDLAPTILEHLALGPLPGAVRGAPIVTDGRLDASSLGTLMSRLRVIGARRLAALGCLLLAWAALLLVCASRPRARARAMRVGALGMLFTPVAVLLPAALEPSAGVEYALLVLACMGLGGLADLLVPWPRAPIVPALVAVVLLSVDALAHTQLLMRSLLGPDPILGARFYGLGNELKSLLAVLALAALAAALAPTVRGRRAAAAMLAAGVALAAIEGSARIGAAVGGAILVSGGFAVALVMLLPGALTRRRALLVLLSPLAALIALAALDLATANGAGHYTGSVLHAQSAGELRDAIVRRYAAAWAELGNRLMPLASALALACAVLGVLQRRRLLAPVQGDPAWQAALAGGLAAGVLGTLVEDSGPVLLVVAVFALGCVSSYLWGRDPLSASTPGRRHESLSRARRRSAAPAR